MDEQPLTQERIDAWLKTRMDKIQSNYAGLEKAYETAENESKEGMTKIREEIKSVKNKIMIGKNDILRLYNYLIMQEITSAYLANLGQLQAKMNKAHSLEEAQMFIALLSNAIPHLLNQIDQSNKKIEDVKEFKFNVSENIAKELQEFVDERERAKRAQREYLG